MPPFVLIPTYNECGNIEKLIREILGIGRGLSIMVVDDTSPDGTGEIVEQLSGEFPQVHVRHREGKLGLGSAYRYGFGEVLKMGADFVIMMDADYSHNPSMIPLFLEAIEDHDVVIGSRYVDGGGIENWSTFRKVISKGGSLYARAWTGIPVKDFTTGYRCYRREVLETIDFSRITVSGYGFMVEMAYLGTALGFDVFELPIVFTDRRVGESKMSGSIFWEALALVPRLKWKYRDATSRTSRSRENGHGRT